MKKIGFIVLTLLCIIFAFAGCTEEEVAQSYEIMLADEINVYEGKQVKLRPHLMDSFGNVVESRFVYSSSSDSITVTQDGEIIINEIPSEDVYITVSDRNTSTEKKIKIHVVQSIQSIDGLTDGNDKLISGLQNVIIGNDYKINVKTSLISFEAKDYCTINVFDTQGGKIETFGVSYDKSEITLKAIGLGKSTVEVIFKNGDGKVIYNSKMDFEIKANDKALSDSILAMQEKETISVSELEGIKLMVLSQSVKDLSELSFLKALDTVVFDSDSVMQCDNLSPEYIYRVKADLLGTYMNSEGWTEIFENVIPYEEDYNEKYVVYRSEKDEILSYALINEDMSLKSLTFAGYTNTGWTDSQGTAVSALTMKELEKNGAHVFAVWVANENDLVFHSNTTANETVSVKAATDSIFTMPQCSFEKEGYTFVGWSKAQQGSIDYLNDSQYTVEPDATISFYAVWEANENLLTFDANKGSGAMESIDINTDETITLPENIFIRNGYTFVGWSKTPTGASEYGNKGQFKMDSSEKVTLYAVWEANTNKLVFQSTSTGESNSVEKNTDQVFNLPVNAFVKPGYTFIGWASVDGGAVEYADAAEFKMPAEKETTLYAIWTPNENTIIFNSNNGSNETATQKAYTDSTVTLNGNTFVYKNYKFVGWSTTPDGEVEYADLASYDVGVNGEYTLYAVWEAYDVFEIKYELLGGVQNPDNKTEYRFDDEIIFYPPTREGYEFVCWCTDEQLTVEITSIPRGSTGDVVVIAKWKANLNTLIFDANGGEGEMEPEKLYTDSAIILKDNAFVRPGYTFVGWKTSPDSENVSYYSGHEYWMGPNSEYTLYAEWSLDTYEVTYELNEGKNDETNPVSYNIHTETIVLKNPTRAGYTFIGWYLDSGFENKLDKIVKGSTGDITLYAKWTANANIVRFDANGGTGTMEPIIVSTDETVELPVNLFTRKGYTFIGWKTVADENIGAEYENGDTYSMSTNSEYILYAVWSKEFYRITYELNGGTNNASNPIEYTVTNEIVLLDPTRNGYEFAGWVNAENDKLQNNTLPLGSTGDIVLYAQWTPKKFTLSFNSNGGSGSMSNVEAYVGQSFNLPQVAFANGKLKFAGWSTSSNGASMYADGASYTMGAGNVTLYAVWTNTEFTIQWVLNGGQNNPNNPIGYSSSVGTELFLNPNNRVGYTFNGWYTDPDFKTPISKIAAGSTKNYVIYAKWTANTYIVDLGEQGKITVTYDSSYANLPTLQKTGYTFLGWYYNDVTLITQTTTVNVASNHTLTPKWKVNTYTISFNANGGSGDTSKKTVAFDSAYGTLPSVARTGYNFNGWYYNGTRIYDTTILKTANNHTLVAQWTPKQYTITFDANGGSVSQSYITVSYYDRVGTLPTPTKTGYIFNGWWLDDLLGPKVTFDTIVDWTWNRTVVADWTPIKYKVTITPDGDGGSITDANGNDIASGTTYNYGQSVQFNVHYKGEIDRSWSINGVGQTDSKVDWKITGDVNIYIYSTHKNCIASGTMVTLADGTQKKVEDLEGDDMLLVFNHETGAYEVAPIMFIENDGWREYTLINLEFSDGTKTRIIYEHALFDLTLNKYVYFNDINYAQFIGHEFVIVDEQMNRTTVTLEKSYKTREYSGCYSLITAYHSNYFIDGLLSIPGGMDGLFNFFEYDKDLAYDSEKMEQDIEKYGLYTYEDFAEYVPYEVFEYMFPAKYYKIAVGKGLITFDEIIGLIEFYLVANGYA